MFKLCKVFISALSTEAWLDILYGNYLQTVCDRSVCLANTAPWGITCGNRYVVKNQREVVKELKDKHKKDTWALTVLTVPPHVLPRAFAGIVGNLICANAPVLAWVPFAFVNIYKSQEKKKRKGALIYLRQTCRQLERPHPH